MERKYIGDRRRVMEASPRQKMDDIVTGLTNLGYRKAKPSDSNDIYAFALRRGFTLTMDKEGLWIHNEAASFHTMVSWRDISLDSVDIREGGRPTIYVGRAGTTINFW